MRSPKQHRLAAQIDSRLSMFQDLADHEVRLIIFTFASHQLRALALPPIGPEVLGESFRRQGDDLVGGRQNGLRAAVVLFERDDGRVGILLGKVEDVTHGGRPKRVDRLGIVTHHGQALAVGPQLVEDFGLKQVGVLVFIDQDAVELLANQLAHLGVGQEGVPVQKQVVVVQRGGRLLAVDVGVEQLFQLVGPLLAPRKMRLQHRLELLSSVDATAVDRHAGPLLGEPPVGLGQSQLGANHVQEVFGVGPIVDGKTGRKSDRLSVLPQQSGGDGVECSAPDPGATEVPGFGSGPGLFEAAEHAGHATEHFGRRASGERQKQDSARVGPRGYEPSYAVHQRGRLAGAGPGDDQQRPLSVPGSLLLLRIEGGQDFVDRRACVHWYIRTGLMPG